jgi:hypothetical protein
MSSVYLLPMSPAVHNLLNALPPRLISNRPQYKFIWPRKGEGVSFPSGRTT